ncbi:type II CRISPR RNA-guided endonuclease Cas9 [Enterococcus mundtii]|uniref:type II CRISPR RNA-guided endonuclease Cas9 n=1 Tax=Enterococcus mundtii TaxID=53346 RepID=UPI000CF0E65E|nr:type II CRISPR RNA-guided endonuclease Cas9 [Enterococcus mundtii]PQC29953.1 type II CRISPR RNA-guided endonuclease Cas9 [Enterococcus mundtii]
MEKEYTIGLDIGTNSVGWAVLTEDYRLVARKMSIQGDSNKKKVKKNFWGSRLFDEGQTAEFRRSKRTNRRRIARRRQRILALQGIFAEEVHKIDPNFFARLEESNRVEEDKRFAKFPIFSTLTEEKNYHQQYPTIYHLRDHLANSKEQADVRLVYLAIAHCLKYRGHFLFEGELDTENTSVNENYQRFLQVYQQFFTEPIGDLGGAVPILTEQLSKAKRVEKVIAHYPNEKSTGTFAQFLKLMVGNQANFKKTFDLEEEMKLDFTRDSFEEDLNELLEKTSDDYADLFLNAKGVYDAILLSKILSKSQDETKAKLSANMKERFEEHQRELKKLKELVRRRFPKKYDDFFKNRSKNGYAGYIEGKATQEDFYKFLRKELAGLDETQPIIAKIDQETYLLKQRTFANGVIPHQIHLAEMREIMDRQKRFYPFLKETQGKIEKLLTFRIPYYVGPLAQEGQSPFAWIKRKNLSQITPWNFEEVVDKENSAIAFIERMTNQDTYLPKEKVLPKQSLIYQRFMIFNELTKVSYTDERGKSHYFSSEQKRKIFDKLFKQHPRVTEKQLKKFLELNEQIDTTEIKGIETSFNASYSTYHDLVKLPGQMDQLLEDPDMTSMFEEIIKILTIFEDREMIRVQLKPYETVLGLPAIKKLAKKHYTGWGRLSEKMIQGIREKQSQKTILDYLIDDDDFPRNRNRNFMQLINDDHLSFKETIANELIMSDSTALLDQVKAIPGSPAIKKGIWQSIKIVEEIVKITGKSPKNIVIEMARENRNTSRSSPRLKSLEEALKNIDSPLLKDYPTDNQALQKDRLYLYYLQNGKDMYTGEPLEIHCLSEYDIDHIIPRSFIVDNSLDNKVLVSSKVNRGKLDNAPDPLVVKRMRPHWEKLQQAKLISDKKLANLTKENLTDADKARFIQRQLVETRQITKHVANILHQHFAMPDEERASGKTRIITLKSTLTSQFRQMFDIHKVREINHHHHAHDAYLNGVVAMTLLKKYPKLAPEFVYGSYIKGDINQINKATAKKEFYSNIMKFFESEEIICDEQGEVIWNKKRDLSTIKKTIGAHQVNIVKKVEKQKGGFYKETINSKANPGKLIPRKSALDPFKYGGYGSPLVAYTVLFTYEKGKQKKVAKGIEGITVMEQARFEQDPREFLKTKGYEGVKQWLILPKYTLFEAKGGYRRMIASHQETQKGNSLILPEHLVTLLYHANHYDEINHKVSFDYVNAHREGFSEIFNCISDFESRYILAPQHLEKIKVAYDKNKEADTKEMIVAILSLLKFTSFGASIEFKFFDIKILKRYQSLTDIWDATLIYQSVTGLYERRVEISKLWDGEQS